MIMTGFSSVLVTFPTLAQSNCYIQHSNGQHIDLGALCGNAPNSPTVSRSKVVIIPIKRRLSGIPSVDVTFSTPKGKKTFEMLFDTGASGITVTGDMANAMGLVPEKSSYSSTAGGVVQIGLSRIASVEVGGLVAKNLPVAINPAMPLQLGLLGQDFYQNYDVTIKQDTIELRHRQ